MNQHELNQEVARATGESIQTIAAMGFSLLRSAPPVRIDYRALARKFRPKHMDLRDRRPPGRRKRAKTMNVAESHAATPDSLPENPGTNAA